MVTEREREREKAGSITSSLNSSPAYVESFPVKVFRKITTAMMLMMMMVK